MGLQIGGLLPAEYLGPGCPSRVLDPHVCLEARLAASVSLRLQPRGISLGFWVFFVFLPTPLTQMFEAICRAAHSCVYNKEVLVWTGRGGEERAARQRSDRCEWRSGGHRTVEVGAERCQFCLWPGNQSMQADVFASFFFFRFFFFGFFFLFFYFFFLFCTSHH